MTKSKNREDIIKMVSKGDLIQCGENWELYSFNYDLHLHDTENGVIFSNLPLERLIDFVPDSFLKKIDRMMKEIGIICD